MTVNKSYLLLITILSLGIFLFGCAKTQKENSTQVTLKTPKNSNVIAYKINSDYEHTPTEAFERDTNALRKYGGKLGATLVRSSTKKYNCHSYAFYSSSPHNTYWIDPADVSILCHRW